MAVLSQYQRKPLVLPDKGILMDGSLVFWAPLWHPHLSLSPFLTKDRYQHLCPVTGTLWGLKGRSFNGLSDLITIPYSTNLVSLSAKTIEAWIYPTPPHEGGYGGVVLNINCDDFNPSRLLVGDAEDTVSQVRFVAGLQNVTGPNVTNNAWNYLVYRYDGANEVIFVNSVKGDNFARTGNMSSGTADMLIGKGHPATYSFKGIIGEHREYNRALSDAEIQHNYLMTHFRYQ